MRRRAPRGIMRAVDPTTDDLSDSADAPARAARARRRHWRATLALTGALLVAWFAVGFGVTWFARDLDFTFFGWPFSFWAAAQGGVLAFVALIAAYARAMARIDRALGPAEPPAPQERA
jgi:putative solute:sodium symporter small subunit